MWGKAKRNWSDGEFGTPTRGWHEEAHYRLQQGFRRVPDHPSSPIHHQQNSSSAQEGMADKEAIRAALQAAAAGQTLEYLRHQAAHSSALQRAYEQTIVAHAAGTSQSLYGYSPAFLNPYSSPLLSAASAMGATELSLYRKRLELEQLEQLNLIRNHPLAASAAQYSTSHQVAAAASLAHSLASHLPLSSHLEVPSTAAATTAAAATPPSTAFASLPSYLSGTANGSTTAADPLSRNTNQALVNSAALEYFKRKQQQKSQPDATSKAGKTLEKPVKKPIRKRKLPTEKAPKSKKALHDPSVPSVSPKTPIPPRLPTRVSVRYCWDELELGTKYGTPAYNAYRRQEHHRLGLEPPADITALQLCREMDKLRPQSIYLPADSPLQEFVERRDLEEVKPPPVEDEKKSKRQDKKSKPKKGKSNSDTGCPVADQEDSEAKLPGRPKGDHSTDLHHALGRLYHMICHQDADDYSRDRELSDGWTVDVVKAKLRSYESQILALDEREKQIVKESKLLGNTDVGVLDEAYTLLGIAPP